MQTMAQHVFEQGEKRAERRVKRDAVLKLLHLRFSSVPESVTKKIRLMRSLSRLDALFEKAATAKTLDEIEL